MASPTATIEGSRLPLAESVVDDTAAVSHAPGPCSPLPPELWDRIAQFLGDDKQALLDLRFTSRLHYRVAMPHALVATADRLGRRDAVSAQRAFDAVLQYVAPRATELPGLARGDAQERMEVDDGAEGVGSQDAGAARLCTPGPLETARALEALGYSLEACGDPYDLDANWEAGAAQLGRFERLLTAAAALDNKGAEEAMAAVGASVGALPDELQDAAIEWIAETNRGLSERRGILLAGLLPVLANRGEQEIVSCWDSLFAECGNYSAKERSVAFVAFANLVPSLPEEVLLDMAEELLDEIGKLQPQLLQVDPLDALGAVIEAVLRDFDTHIGIELFAQVLAACDRLDVGVRGQALPGLACSHTFLPAPKAIDEGARLGDGAPRIHTGPVVDRHQACIALLQRLVHFDDGAQAEVLAGLARAARSSPLNERETLDLFDELRLRTRALAPVHQGRVLFGLSALPASLPEAQMLDRYSSVLEDGETLPKKEERERVRLGLSTAALSMPDTLAATARALLEAPRPDPDQTSEA